MDLAPGISGTIGFLSFVAYGLIALAFAMWWPDRSRWAYFWAAGGFMTSVCFAFLYADYIAENLGAGFGDARAVAWDIVHVTRNAVDVAAFLVVSHLTFKLQTLRRERDQLLQKLNRT